MAKIDIKDGQGLAVIVPHGDLSEALLNFIPKNRIKDTIYFNPADFDFPIGFNPLEKLNPDHHHLVASNLISVFKKLWQEFWGPRMEYILRNGILTLLERRNLTPPRIKKVYLAGGFGLHLVKEHAIGCGLLPGFDPDQIEVVGNTSLAGAYLALLDCGALDEIARAARKMDIIELNQDPQFEDRYIDQLHLP